MSVGAIGAIDGIGGMSYVSPVDNSFQINNRSKVSDAYRQRIEKTGGADKVNPVDPVQYANASMQTKAVSKTQDAVDVSKAYNDIAKSFSGNTGYNSAAAADTYSVVGSKFDMFA